MLLSLNAIGGQSHGTDTASSFLFFYCNCVLCTVRDYHRVEFQALIIKNHLQMCLSPVANFLLLSMGGISTEKEEAEP